MSLCGAQKIKSGADYRIAVVIPCYNEAKTIGQVVKEFKLQLPDAGVYVGDNNSKDSTVQEAQRAGATVLHEKRQGKGFAIRSLFSQVDADIYGMVDGDCTYPTDRVHDLIAPVIAGHAEMVIGSRLHAGSNSRFNKPNLLGNLVFRFLFNLLFRVQLTDLLSGYRALSRRAVKTISLRSHGFESDTELTMKCLERGYRIVEIPVNLRPRPRGSYSKIKIIRDGLLILNTIFTLMRDYKPLTAFGSLGLLFIGSGLVPGFVVVREFLARGSILRVSFALLSIGLVITGLLLFFAGLILHTIARRFSELDDRLQELTDYFSGTRAAEEPTQRSWKKGGF